MRISVYSSLLKLLFQVFVATEARCMGGFPSFQSLPSLFRTAKAR